MNPYQNPNQNNLLLRSTVDRTITEINQKQNKTKPKVMTTNLRRKEQDRAETTTKLKQNRIIVVE